MIRTIAGIFLILTIMACGKGDGFQDIELKPTPVSQIQNLYGVVTLPTLRLRDEPNSESEMITVLFRGTIVEVDSIDQRDVIIDGTEGRWLKLRYKGRHGWGFGGYIELYESLDAARRGVEKLRQVDELD